MSEFKLIIQPDEEEPEAAEVLVDGTIDGRPYRFMLDTGAARTHIGFDEYTAHFTTSEQHHSSGVFASSSSDLITVPRIELGDIAKTNLTVVRMAEGASELRNLLGMDFLKDLRCHFQFDQQRVIVDEPDDTSYDFQDLFLDKGSHAYVDVQFEGVLAKTVWDTGAGITIADLSFIEKHPTLFQELGNSTGTDATGTSMQTPMFIMSSSIIGGQIFPPHKVAGVDLSGANATIEVPMNLILGYSTYRLAHWLFDFTGRKWTITKMLNL